MRQMLVVRHNPATFEEEVNALLATGRWVVASFATIPCYRKSMGEVAWLCTAVLTEIPDALAPGFTAGDVSFAGGPDADAP